MGQTKKMAAGETVAKQSKPSAAKIPLTESAKIAKINRKIQELAQRIGKLEKDGTNQHSRYDYISSEAMATALRSHLLECNLSIIPSIIDFSERDWTGANGKLTIRSTVNMAFTITDLETGFQLLEHFCGAEQDTGGKSLQQAVTQCTKYFYFKLFNVTAKEETDGDSETKTVEPTKPSPTPKKAVTTNKLTAKQVENILEQPDEYKYQVLNKIVRKELNATTAQYKQIKNSLTKNSNNNEK